MFKRIKNKPILQLILLLFATMLVYHAWFFSFGIMTSGDWGFYLKTTAETLRINYFSLWLSDYSFGRVLIDVGQAPTYFLYGVFSKYLNFDYALTERLIHFWPAVILAPISSYFLAKEIFKNNVAALLGAIIYSFNTYAITLQTGHLTLAGAYAIIPALLWLYIRLYKKPSISLAIFAGIVLSICGAYEPREVYIAAWLLLLITAWLLLIGKKNKIFSKQNFIQCVYFCLPIIIFISLNFYWLYGLSGVRGSVGSDVLDRGLFGNKYFNISQALTLFHPYWNGAEPIPFIVNPIPLYFWLIPIFAAMGLFFFRQNRTVLFFGFIALLGVFLTKQSALPFTGFYQWLYDHLPGFNAYREASKFYVLIALGYSIIIPALYVWLVQRKSDKAALATAASIVAVFVLNVIPIATQSIGTTFVARELPNEYRNLNDWLNSKEYYRIFWLPKESRWSLSNDIHPRVSAVDIVQTTWKKFIDDKTFSNESTSRIQITDLFDKNYFSSLLNVGAIKYFIVPLRDIKNNDDFYIHYGDDMSTFVKILSKQPYLTKVNNDSFTIYENKSAKPYVFALDQVIKVEDATSLEGIYNFVTKKLGIDYSNFNFIISQDNIPFTTGVKDLFAGINRSKINQAQYAINGTDRVGSRLYSASESFDYFYSTDSKALYLKRRSAPNPISGIKQGNLETITQTSLINNNYYLVNGDVVTGVAPNVQMYYLGRDIGRIDIYSSSSENIVKNGNMNNGLWSNLPDDCNDYGPNPKIKLKEANNERDSSKSVMLSSESHAACTGPGKIAIDGSRYLLSFDYKVKEGKEASYQLAFDTPSDTRPNVTHIPVVGDSWKAYTTLISAPAGAQFIDIKLSSYPSDQIQQVTENYYDNLSVKKLTYITAYQPVQQSIDPADSEKSKIDYRDQNYTYENKILNASFEDGLWQKKVSDCDAYDSNPNLGMKLSNIASNGMHSLQLEAGRHIACTGTPFFSVTPNANYLLDFKYQSANAKEAGYALSFNDAARSTISERLGVKDDSWANFSKVITVPNGATKANLTIYSYSDNDGSKKVVRYDDFYLTEIPDIANKYYSLSAAAKLMKVPKNITYKKISQTEVSVKVTSANEPFLLAMSEAYHEQWSAEIKNSSNGYKKINQHFALDGFVNSWYIDTSKVCSYKNECYTEPDGSYSMDLILSFSPQKRLKTGLMVSVSALILCFISLLLIFIMKRVKRDIS